MVSVIVPVRDRRDLLTRTLEALRAQTYPPDRFEVIVVDDGSTDGTAEAAEAAAGPLDLRVERRERAGAVAARNHGAAVARGEVLAFTDSDCRPAPGWLAAVVAALETADAVQGLTLADPTMHRGPLHRTVEAGGDAGLFDSCNLALRTEAFRAVDGFDPAFARRIRVPRSPGQVHYGFGEDTDLGWRIIRSGRRLAFEPQALVHHHVFEPGLRESIGRMWLVGAFPSLVREFPELRERLLKHRLFLTEDRPYVWLALAGVWLGRRRPAALALTLPYAYRKVARGHGGRRERLRTLPAQALLDAVATAGLVVGSIRARRVVL